MDIFAFTCIELAHELGRRYGRGMYHAAALYREIFVKGAEGIEGSNAFAASPRLAAQIGADLRLPGCRPAALDEDGDVVKFATRLIDGCVVESVIIPTSGRTTLCVSSQVGCRMGCRFCATGRMGFVRDLMVSEIVWQLWAARFKLGHAVDHVVFMGMGEPLDNLDAVVQAVRVMTDQRGLAIPPSHVAVSTAGLAPGISRLAAVRPDSLRLAVSVNAVTDDLRTRLMPINRRYPLATLKAALMAFTKGRRDFLLIEYVLLAGINDTDADAEGLAAFLEGLPARVNLIAYNGEADSLFAPPDDAGMVRFRDRLAANRVFVRIRRSRGRKVMAACGQLGSSMRNDSAIPSNAF